MFKPILSQFERATARAYVIDKLNLFENFQKSLRPFPFLLGMEIEVFSELPAAEVILASQGEHNNFEIAPEAGKFQIEVKLDPTTSPSGFNNRLRAAEKALCYPDWANVSDVFHVVGERDIPQTQLRDFFGTNSRPGAMVSALQNETGSEENARAMQQHMQSACATHFHLGVAPFSKRGRLVHDALLRRSTLFSKVFTEAYNLKPRRTWRRWLNEGDLPAARERLPHYRQFKNSEAMKGFFLDLDQLIAKDGSDWIANNQPPEELNQTHFSTYWNDVRPTFHTTGTVEFRAFPALPPSGIKLARDVVLYTAADAIGRLPSGFQPPRDVESKGEWESYL